MVFSTFLFIHHPNHYYCRQHQRDRLDDRFEIGAPYPFHCSVSCGAREIVASSPRRHSNLRATTVKKDSWRHRSACPAANQNQLWVAFEKEISDDFRPIRRPNRNDMECWVRQSENNTR